MTHEQTPQDSPTPEQGIDWTATDKLLSLAEQGLIADPSTLSSLAEQGDQIKKDEYTYGGETIQGTDIVVNAKRHVGYRHVTTDETGKISSSEVPIEVGERLVAFAAAHPELVPEKPAPKPQAPRGAREARTTTRQGGATRADNPRDKNAGPRDWKQQREPKAERVFTGKPEQPSHIHNDLWAKMSSAEKWQEANGTDPIPRPPYVSKEAWDYMDDQAKWENSFAIHTRDKQLASQLPDPELWNVPRGMKPAEWARMSPAMKRRSIGLRNGTISESVPQKQIDEEKTAKAEKLAAEKAANTKRKRLGRFAVRSARTLDALGQELGDAAVVKLTAAAKAAVPAIRNGAVASAEFDRSI